MGRALVAAIISLGCLVGGWMLFSAGNRSDRADTRAAGLVFLWLGALPFAALAVLWALQDS
jgi:hypothetical protein